VPEATIKDLTDQLATLKGIFSFPVGFHLFFFFVFSTGFVLLTFFRLDCS
jgi:hypothetical protein